MASSFALYAACALAAAGAVSLVRPLRFLGIRNRWWGALVGATGYIAASVILGWPARTIAVERPPSSMDAFAPEYQFGEVHEIPVRASAEQVYAALMSVSVDEVPFFRELAWIRRGGNEGPESILNPPDRVPLVAVAARTSFVVVSDRPGAEHVMGTVVIAPAGVRLALGSTPESFTALTQPGFAKATIGFYIEPMKVGWCRLRTETRVSATDDVSRATFARYWRIIAPGSAFLRRMWLRAVKVRAETLATAPPVGRADWEWIDRLARERRPQQQRPEDVSPVRLRR